MVARNVKQQLLAEVKKRQRAAGQKVSRIESRSGVDLRGNGVDPRASASVVNAMDARQLRRYLGQLNSFTDRSNQYVAGINGKPISRSTFNAIQAEQAKFNAEAERRMSQIGRIVVQGSGLTVQQRAAMMKPEERFQAGGWQSVFAAQDRTAGAINGEAAAQRILRSLKRKNTKTYFDREMAIQRQVILKKLAANGDTQAYAKVKSLNNFQLNILLDHSDFRASTDLKYDEKKSTNEDSQRWQSEVYDDAEENVNEKADWAKTLPKNGDAAQRTTDRAVPDRSSQRKSNTRRKRA